MHCRCRRERMIGREVYLFPVAVSCPISCCQINWRSFSCIYSQTLFRFFTWTCSSCGTNQEWGENATGQVWISATGRIRMGRMMGRIWSRAFIHARWVCLCPLLFCLRYTRHCTHDIHRFDPNWFRIRIRHCVVNAEVDKRTNVHLLILTIDLTWFIRVLCQCIWIVSCVLWQRRRKKKKKTSAIRQTLINIFKRICRRWSTSSMKRFKRRYIRIHIVDRRYQSLK